MSSPSSNDPKAVHGSEPPPTSAVRPREPRAMGERTTLPGTGRPMGERTTTPGVGDRPLEYGASSLDARNTDPSPERLDPTLHDVELALEDSELERVKLVDMPALGRYGRYELLGRLAYGGMAEIFLAREAHVSAHRMMVIKRVLPHVAEDRHFVDMFIDEARLAMQLNHPNICHVYSFGEEGGTYYIAMEWVNGKPLSKIIRHAREQGGLPIPIALKIIAQVADALDYAHRACDASGEPLGIVHRDVSPQNIMVSYDGAVKLLDFGIAKATSHSTRTEAGVIKGKFAYMSPQQCVGEPIDGRADIFALGVCLFEALTGKNPFRRKTEFDTMTRIVGEKTPSAREKRKEIPEEVELILETALMKQPERRFQSAGEMQLAIEAAIPKLGMVVSSARIGELMAKLFADEVRDGPQLDMRLSAPPVRVGTGLSMDESLERSPAPRPKPPGSTELDAEPIARAPEPASPPKKSGIGPIAIVLTLVVLVGLVATGGVLAWTLFAPRPEATVATDPVVESQNEAPTIANPSDAPVTTGTVFIDSVPPGATIQFGNRGNAGTTPIEIGMVQPGTYDVRMALEGHAPWSGRVQVVAGQRSAVNAQLSAEAHELHERPRQAAGPPGRLSLNTQPWSKVYLGSRLLGTTPLGGVAVPSGTQRLRLVDRDGNEHRRSVRIPPGGEVTESFDLRQE